jgi:hypothetical protein
VGIELVLQYGFGVLTEGHPRRRATVVPCDHFE